MDAKIIRYELDGRRLIQIDTMGSRDRKIPGKVSQSIQLDEHSARQLFEIMKDHFRFK
ncbi:methionyl-tRNA formyltransferase [Mesorhizobium microcysteis]|uniref:Methionyl-tRNA formyltransferase n=1 Tax=Neoaquamicrobium microcysteis TaxID=2682781 RepID=A0A5D4GV37_9HYPH|nr:methionyl-tRNA formyltransferase [Mesorhizobium microcysteis]